MAPDHRRSDRKVSPRNWTCCWVGNGRYRYWIWFDFWLEGSVYGQSKKGLSRSRLCVFRCVSGLECMMWILTSPTHHLSDSLSPTRWHWPSPKPKISLFFRRKGQQPSAACNVAIWSWKTVWIHPRFVWTRRTWFLEQRPTQIVNSVFRWCRRNLETMNRSHRIVIIFTIWLVEVSHTRIWNLYRNVSGMMRRITWNFFVDPCWSFYTWIFFHFP